IQFPGDKYRPIVRWENGHGKIENQLLSIGAAVRDRPGNTRKDIPTLIVVIIPEGGNDIYTSVKQWEWLLNA
ncbi:hypothetical protein H0H92_001341, partial [Tricholoma furcatifolium]